MSLKRTTLLFLIFLPLLACQHPREIAVRILPLAAPLNAAEIELSGLSWCQGKLLLLPQYPERLNQEQHPYLYFLIKDDIHRALSDTPGQGLKASKVRIEEHGLRERISHFDGYEAIACDGTNAWLTIEAVDPQAGYQSYLIHGTVDFDATPAVLKLNPDKLWPMASQSGIVNMGHETVLVHHSSVVSLHEINDARLVKTPHAFVLETTSGEPGQLAFPPLPYRITDATTVDHQGRFWVINYKYSGDAFSRDAVDPLVQQYGAGPSHRRYHNVERLVEYQISDRHITRVNQAPVQLRMNHVEGRNWEGIARFDDLGFLLVTDKYPQTLFAFVPYRTTNHQ